jgi:outer membrane protein TolC
MVIFPTLAALALAAAPPAPLAALLEAARIHNHTLGVSRAQLAEQEAAVQQSLTGLIPTFQATGAYTRNQYAATFTVPNSLLSLPGAPGATTALTIQPYNQWNANLALTVPIVNLGALVRYGEAKHGREASREAEKASEGDVLLSTATTYYQVVAAQGLLDAAVRALATAKDNLDVVKAKQAAGSANQLSVDRAQVDVNSAGQTIALARQTLGLARRSLETLTGEKVTADFPAPEVPELPPGAEADYLDQALKSRPEIAQAKETLAQQEGSVNEAWMQLAPTLSAAAHEYFTNAPGFITSDDYWTVGLSLSWNVDPVGTHAALRKAEATIDEEQERLAQAEDSVRDEVHTAWLGIEADQARLTDATSQVSSAREALALTQEQYRAGTATSLDISQAQRDAFNADATLAQCKSDLAAALLSLRKAAGQSLLAEMP